MTNDDGLFQPRRMPGKHRPRPAPLPQRVPGMNHPHGPELLLLETEVFLAKWEIDKAVCMNTMGYMLQAAARRPPIGNW